MKSSKTVILRMTKEEAERFVHGISDISCILLGIEIAKPKTAALFLGREEIRELNIKLKRAINDSENGNDISEEVK